MDFRHICHCIATIFDYLLVTDEHTNQFPPIKLEANMTRDELNSELRMHSATFPAVMIVYGTIVATMVLSALAML